MSSPPCQRKVDMYSATCASASASAGRFSQPPSSERRTHSAARAVAIAAAGKRAPAARQTSSQAAATARAARDFIGGDYSLCPLAKRSGSRIMKAC